MVTELIDEVAVQLYSVRDAVQQDLEGTLKRLHDLGYRGVELAGFGGAKPERWSHLLLSNHLTPVAMHVDYQRLDQDLERALADADVIGSPVLVLPWIPEELRTTQAAWIEMAHWMNRVGERVREQGKRFAYHNHAFEFDKVGAAATGYDLLVQSTDPALVEFELDIFWAAKADQSVPDLAKRLGKRMTLCHVKDMTGDAERTFAPVGGGVLPWKTWLDLLPVQALIVEQDACADPDPFNCLKSSIDYLKSGI